MDFNKKSVAIIGSGPAGCMCAYFESKNNNVTLFDFAPPLHTLIYTGGGRCNLAYAEYDFKELAKFYPRGEKFLYSVFSKFSTIDTINFFKEIGVETYVQDDLRIFPISNSAKDIKEKFLKSLTDCKFKKERVLKVKSLAESHDKLVSASNKIALTEKIPKQVRDDENKKDNYRFLLKTGKNSYTFDKIVIATGGHSGFSLAENFGHRIITPKPALTGLITAENFKPIQGISLKNIKAEIFFFGKKFPLVQDDMIFTHEGISGPLAYKISSICARLGYNKENPIKIKLNLLQKEINLQDMLNSNPKKTVKNLISEFIPKSLADYILKTNQINSDLKCYEVNGVTRDLILKNLKEFQINVISPAKEGEIVTSGGVCLDEINPKTMQSKLVEGLFFCGEVIDVDGFCGGFNLQNCWSTGFVAGGCL